MAREQWMYSLGVADYVYLCTAAERIDVVFFVTVLMWTCGWESSMASPRAKQEGYDDNALVSLSGLLINWKMLLFRGI